MTTQQTQKSEPIAIVGIDKPLYSLKLESDLI